MLSAQHIYPSDRNRIRTQLLGICAIYVSGLLCELATVVAFLKDMPNLQFLTLTLIDFVGWACLVGKIEREQGNILVPTHHLLGAQHIYPTDRNRIQTQLLGICAINVSDLLCGLVAEVTFLKDMPNLHYPL
ncbi:MAG: hypothetical protein BGO78_11470 [Chloroflexi bacterium 44-23]|nr:MAG: hypothetical protein BGO78_11470 [Chloroflexi bacterium 44-23]